MTITYAGTYCHYQAGELKGSSDVEVGVVCLSGDHSLLAAGLEDGSIVLWDIQKRSIRVTLK